MSKHTPGPWTIDVAYGGWSIRSKGIMLALSGGSISTWITPEDEDAANARLIAAAPDLLEALKRVCSHGYRTSPDWDNARAAIAKAEGA
jgi:hypothetical protein